MSCELGHMQNILTLSFMSHAEDSFLTQISRKTRSFLTSRSFVHTDLTNLTKAHALPLVCTIRMKHSVNADQLRALLAMQPLREIREICVRQKKDSA